MDKFSVEMKEEYISYDRYKIEREQRMFDESFYIVDMEDSTEEEAEDIRMLVTIIFSSFHAEPDVGNRSRRRLSNETSDTSNVTINNNFNNDNKLFDDNQMANPRKVERLFQKASLRDVFLKECVKRIPETKTLIVMSPDSFSNLSTSLRAIVLCMIKTNERDAAKFIDLLRILNTFYTKFGDNKQYLFQQLNDAIIFRDITLWAQGYRCLFKKKKQDQDSKIKPQGTILNPWRVLHGIQSIIVKKNNEEELQGVGTT